MAEFFGFEINRKGKGTPRPSFVPDTEADGAGVIQTGGHFGIYLDAAGDNPDDRAKGGTRVVGARRPYRWWKQRACVEENAAWGRRVLTIEQRVKLCEVERILEERRTRQEEREEKEAASLRALTAELREMQREEQERRRGVLNSKVRLPLCVSGIFRTRTLGSGVSLNQLMCQGGCKTTRRTGRSPKATVMFLSARGCGWRK